MLHTFGARLRQRREEQSIALATIAEKTKIQVSLLEALERDDVSRWPTGIFRKAYIRSYAEAIRLDPDATVHEFLALYPEPTKPIEPERPPPPPGRLRAAVSAMRSLVGVGRDRADSHEIHVDADLPKVCTALGRIATLNQAGACLADVARMLHAAGLVVFVWDDRSSQLKPELAHGYSSKTLDQLRPVSRDAHNVTAAAFRAAELRMATGGARGRSAMVVPLLTARGCRGVLAAELGGGAEPTASVRHAATIVAAMLAQMITPPESPAASRVSAAVPAKAAKAGGNSRSSA